MKVSPIRASVLAPQELRVCAYSAAGATEWTTLVLLLDQATEVDARSLLFANEVLVTSDTHASSESRRTEICQKGIVGATFDFVDS